MHIPHKLKSIKLILATGSIVLITVLTLILFYNLYIIAWTLIELYLQNHDSDMLITVEGLFRTAERLLFNFGASLAVILGLYSGANIYSKKFKPNNNGGNQ